MQEYPLSIRDVSPHPEAIRLTGINPDGTPNGFHTGGAWLINGEVWKSLDGRPFANCPNHYSTEEDVVLEEMADRPLFPRNWRVEEVNGRRFLVRKEAHVIDDFSDLDEREILKVEQAVRTLNATGWEVGDPITLAKERKSYQLFILDLSNAHKMKGSGAFAANEEWRIHKLFEQANLHWYVNLRTHARHVLTNIDFFERKRDGYIHVYASFNRPIDGMWASIPNALYIHTEKANWLEGMPHTWVVCKSLLDNEIIRRYELRWGWSPI